MTDCLNEKLGTLLHAYELDLLDERQRQEFEVHLLECTHCWHELIENRETVQLLRNSARVRAVVSEEAPHEENDHAVVPGAKDVPRKQRLGRLSLVTAAAVILLMLYPSYLGISFLMKSPIQRANVIALLPVRSQNVPVIRRSSGDMVTLTFQFPGAVPDQSYAVTVINQAGKTVFQDPAFGPFSNYQTAHLMLRLADLPDGDYRLIIGVPEHPDQEYIFKIAR